MYEWPSKGAERRCAPSLAKEAVSSSLSEVKQWFDKKAVMQQFKPGDEVLVLLPISTSARDGFWSLCGGW